MNDDADRTQYPFRETYSEYTDDGTLIGMIRDPDNADAWLPSTHAVDIEH